MSVSPVPNAAVVLFPWDRFADQGERVFEIVFLVLWFGFVASSAYFGLRLIWEKKKTKIKDRRKRPKRRVAYTDRRSTKT